jgi:hypothetical protein
MRTKVFATTRSGQGRAVCARSSKTLDGEDGRIRWQVREGGVLYQCGGALRMDSIMTPKTQRKRNVNVYRQTNVNVHGKVVAIEITKSVDS